MIMQLTVFLENSEGRLADLCRTLANAGVNMSALTIAETSDYGIVRIICDNVFHAVDVLDEAGFRATKTKVMAVDLAKYGIRVNAFAPGFVDTRVAAKSLSDPEKMERLKSQWCIKRPSKPSEQAAVALFLASDDAAYINGEVISVNGGLYS